MKQMIFQNCFYKHEIPQYNEIYYDNQDEQKDNSQFIQFKRLNGNITQGIACKQDLKQLFKIARNNKQELSLKLKLDLNELTKFSATYVKVQVLKKNINQEERSTQFVFLEMPITNIINSYNQFDIVKKFVFDSHKSLGSMLKLLQQIRRNDYQKIQNNVKFQQFLKQSLVGLLLQDTLLFSNPCQAVINLSIPSDLKNWQVSNLSLGFVSQIRDKTTKIANCLQNQDIIVQTLNTIDEELDQVDAQIMDKMNTIICQEQQYKKALNSFQNQNDNPEMLIYQNDQEAYNQNLNQFYDNLIQQDKFEQKDIIKNNQQEILNYDQDARNNFQLLIQIYKQKLQELRLRNQSEQNLKIDNQIQINNELQKIKYRIEQIQNQFGIIKPSVKINETQIFSVQMNKPFDNTYQSTPQQQLAQLSNNYQNFINSQKENVLNKCLNRVSFSPSNYSSKQITSKKLLMSESNTNTYKREDFQLERTPQILLDNIEEFQYSKQGTGLQSEQKQSNAMRTISSRTCFDNGKQKSNLLKYQITNDQKWSENKQMQKQKKGSVTSPHTPQNINFKGIKQNKNIQNSIQRKPRTAGSSLVSRKDTSLSPHFNKDNPKKYKYIKSQRENDQKQKINSGKRKINKSSTQQSLVRSQTLDEKQNKSPSVNTYSNDLRRPDRKKSEKIINIQNKQVNGINYKHEQFKDIKTQNRLNYLVKNQSKKQNQNKVQIKQNIQQPQKNLSIISRNDKNIEKQKKVDFSFQKLESFQLNQSQYDKNQLKTGFKKLISDHTKKNENGDFEIVTQRIENQNPTLFGVDEKHIATQDSQFYGNVVGDTIQPYCNPLLSYDKINQSIDPNHFANPNLQGSFQKKSQALLEQYRLKKNSILKNQPSQNLRKKSKTKIISRDSQKSSKIRKREQSQLSERDKNLVQSFKNIENLQVNQDLMLQKIEIKHLKENLQMAQQMQTGIEKALAEEIKEMSQLIKQGDEKQLNLKIQELLSWKVKAKIKRNKILMKLMEERRQRKRVQAQRDLLLSKRSSKNSHKKNASIKSSKKSRKHTRSNKSKSILSNKSNFMNNSSKFTDLQNYSVSQMKELSKSRNNALLKKNKTFQYQIQKKDLNQIIFSQPSSYNRGKSQISFVLNRTAGELEEDKKKMKKNQNTESIILKKSRSQCSTGVKNQKKNRSFSKTLEKQNEIIDLLEKENVKFQKEYVIYIQHAQGVQKHLEQQLIEIKEHLLTQESQKFRIQTDIENLKKQNETLKLKNQEQEDKINSMKTEKDYIQEIKVLNQQIENCKMEKEEFKLECERLTNIEQAKDSYRKDCLQLREENKEFNRSIQALQKSLNAQKAQNKNNDQFYKNSHANNKDSNSFEKQQKKIRFEQIDCLNSDKENVF